MKLWAWLFLFAVPVWAADMEKRLQRLETELEKLDTRVAILSERSNLMIQRTTLSFLNTTYYKAGLSLLFPRARTFNYTTDTGLGVFVGAGRYFGRNHVVDLSLDWDLYPGASFRYRYEWRGNTSNVTFSPVLGVKAKLLNAKPLDKFLDSNEELQSLFGIAGVAIAIPTGLSVIHTEIAAFLNRQVVISASLGVHLFL